MKRSMMICLLTCLALVSAMGCLLTAFGTGAWEGVRPLSAAEARAARGSQACGQANVVSNWACDGMLAMSCSHTWYGTCCVNCRDGCTKILDNLPATLGTGSWGYEANVSCGTPGLGMTYNVRNCKPFSCCTGTITGTFACNGAAATVWIICS